MDNPNKTLLTASEIENYQESKFDDSPEYGTDIYETKLSSDLTDFEIQDARFLSQFTRGLYTVTGQPGSGKGVTVTSLSWKMNRYFGKKKVLDYKPRRLYGDYSQFNELILLEQIQAMAEVAKASGITGKDRIKAAASATLARSQLDFVNSVMGLDEFWRYVKKRRTGTNINYFITGLVKILRHLDCCMLGASPSIDELDQQEIANPIYLSADMRCKWSRFEKDTTIVKIRRLRALGSSGNVELDPMHVITYKINGGMSRPEVGVSIGTISYRGDSITERAIINYVKENEIADLRDLSKVIDKDVETCKRWCLKLMHEHYLTGKRYFDLFNSKDMKNIAYTKIKTTIEAR
jgi:hypothetical protein